MDRLADLRTALAAELAAPEMNSDRIAELAAALVESDPTRARFSVDAGMLARLGRELVARHETALSELVKTPTTPTLSASRFASRAFRRAIISRSPMTVPA